MANVILSPALSLFDLRRKFGIWVKPFEVAASAPLRMMFRSLRMSPMWRSRRNSIPGHYSALAYTTRAYPLLRQLPDVRVVVRVCRPTEKRRQHFLQARDQVVGLSGALGEIFDLVVLHRHLAAQKLIFAFEALDI